MKHLIEKPAETAMSFFTPELFLRFNSLDDEVADRAAEEWETAIRNYRDHLSGFCGEMSDRVRRLAFEICLHDAEWVALQADVPEWPILPFRQIPVAGILLNNGNEWISIVYFLWDEIREASTPEAWPMSTSRPHWLYDEIDVELRRPDLYYHRILLSDGRVIAVPFFDVVVQTYLAEPEEDSTIARTGA